MAKKVSGCTILQTMIQLVFWTLLTLLYALFVFTNLDGEEDCCAKENYYYYPYDPDVLKPADCREKTSVNVSARNETFFNIMFVIASLGVLNSLVKGISECTCPKMVSCTYMVYGGMFVAILVMQIIVSFWRWGVTGRFCAGEMELNLPEDKTRYALNEGLFIKIQLLVYYAAWPIAVIAIVACLLVSEPIH